jgi:hypothetical protein
MLRVLPNSISFSVFVVLVFFMTCGGFVRPAQKTSENPDSKMEANQLVREVVQNEVHEENDRQTLWRYRELDEKKGRKELNDVIETKIGSIRRLVSVNGQPLSSAQNRAQNAHIRGLEARPAEVRNEQRKQDEDNRKEARLFESFPSTFNFQYDGRKGDLIKLKFTPNPQFRASGHEEEVFHHMDGTMWVDQRQKRLVELEGRLTGPVKFGGGLLGHLDQGGTFSVQMKDLGSGHWALESLVVDMKGKALIFKTIGVQQNQQYMDYKPVAGNMTVKQAARILLSEKPISEQASRAPSEHGATKD